LPVQVTVVSYLDMYGIDLGEFVNGIGLGEFVKTMQRAAAVSTTVVKVMATSTLFKFKTTRYTFWAVCFEVCILQDKMRQHFF
jgi:hypothetical protein